MNRKLVNGLLLLSIATVGCGTFTSCKDTDEDVKGGINAEIASVYADLLQKIEDAKCKCPDYEDALSQIANWLGGTYDPTTGSVNLPDSFNDKVLDNLKVALETNNPGKIVPAIASVQEEINKMMTSIEINQTYNPVFGTLNLPIGLQSNILAAYYGTTDHDIVFPSINGTEYEVGNKPDLFTANTLMQNMTVKGGTINIGAGEVYMDNDGSLGHMYLTINPLNAAPTTLDLIKSNGEKAPVTLTPTASDDVLTFGYTRADNGLYKVAASIDKGNASQLAIPLKPEFKSSVKNLLTNPGTGTLAKLGKALLDQMNGVLPAYGVRAPWSIDTKYTIAKDEEGKWAFTAEEGTNAIVSKYELAAATIHPLGYNTFDGVGTSHRLPTFSPLREVIDNLFEDLKDDLNFTLDIKGVKKFNVNFEISNIKIDKTKLIITIPQIDINGSNGQKTEETTITLTYDPDKGVEDIHGNDGALNPLINQIVDKVNEMLTEGDNSIQSQVENNIIAQVNQMVDEINAMLVGTADKPGINGQINEQIGTILNKIEAQLAGKLDAAQKLLDLYNKVANKINNFLANPHAYMQVAMLYTDGNGNPHMLSTDPNDPSVFVADGGNAISLFATSYTGDLATPSYKKYVAVVDASNGKVAEVNNASTYLNKVISGRQHIVDFTGFEKGATYTIVYSSLDYRGNTSTRLYYLTVK